MKSKLILGLTLLTLCWACQQKQVTPEKENQEYAQLSGTIKNYNGAVLKIQDFMGRSNWETEIEINNGTFSTNLSVDMPMVTTLSFGRTFKTIFLQQGENLEIAFDTKAIDSTFSYAGSLAKENAILDSIQTEQRKMDFKYVYGESLGDASQYLDSVTKAHNSYLTDLTKDKTLQPKFKEYAKASIDYNSAMYKLYIASRKDKHPDDYFDFIDDLDIENKNFLGILDYRFFLNEYITMTAQKRVSQLDSIQQDDPDTLLAESLKVIEDLENEDVKNFALFNAMNMRLRERGISGFSDYYEYFKKNNKDPYYANQLELVYEKKQSLAPGQPAPDFKLEDIDGKMVSLSDFKGKYVYLDFWHTGCPYCIKETDAYVELYADYADKDIAFVSISADLDKSKWKNYVLDNKNAGVSLITENFWDSEEFQNYQIISSPTYVLVDKEGNIIDSKAPFPSSPEIRETFDELLKN
ncbi:TlpA family protein disulfide reductase [Flavobacteriaceae bacterium 14752]|uniref:TlpA family protein disulfide reductase n=1 Tax=Mesohalobacter salilacus TaxID=2491711 RepID=UPI000F6347C6|nr:TlpA family protein disulfide reductase [Flavobacteriaceae bacterium 14752]